MRILPKDIAKALVDSVEAGTPVDAAIGSALEMLRLHCLGTSRSQFLSLVEKEMRRQGRSSSALLIVPHDTSISAEDVQKQLTAKGRKIPVERATDPSLIGGAVLHVDHTRIDSSVRGALETLLQLCLQPLG